MKKLPQQKNTIKVNLEIEKQFAFKKKTKASKNVEAESLWTFRLVRWKTLKHWHVQTEDSMWTFGACHKNEALKAFRDVAEIFPPREKGNEIEMIRKQVKARVETQRYVNDVGLFVKSFQSSHDKNLLRTEKTTSKFSPKAFGFHFPLRLFLRFINCKSFQAHLTTHRPPHSIHRISNPSATNSTLSFSLHSSLAPIARLKFLPWFVFQLKNLIPLIRRRNTHDSRWRERSWRRGGWENMVLKF